MVGITDAKPLTPEQLARYRSMHRVTFPACAASCDQGRKLCPSPEACQEDPLNPSIGILVGLSIVGGIVGVSMLLHRALS